LMPHGLTGFVLGVGTAARTPVTHHVSRCNNIKRLKNNSN
jgi:hypothetical protein